MDTTVSARRLSEEVLYQRDATIPIDIHLPPPATTIEHPQHYEHQLELAVHSDETQSLSSASANSPMQSASSQELSAQHLEDENYASHIHYYSQSSYGLHQPPRRLSKSSTQEVRDLNYSQILPESPAATRGNYASDTTREMPFNSPPPVKGSGSRLSGLFPIISTADHTTSGVQREISVLATPEPSMNENLRSREIIDSMEKSYHRSAASSQSHGNDAAVALDGDAGDVEDISALIHAVADEPISASKVKKQLQYGFI